MKVHGQCPKFLVITQLDICIVLVEYHGYHIVADRDYHCCVNGNYSLLHSVPAHLAANIS